MHQVSTAQQQTTATTLDNYCQYYSDFSKICLDENLKIFEELTFLGKILSIYIRNFYPQLHYEFDQLLDASYNVWHRLNDHEKISLANFLEELNCENVDVSFKYLDRVCSNRYDLFLPSKIT